MVCLIYYLTTGTDEAAIINVLSHRSNKQRQDIKQRFKLMYGKVCIVVLCDGSAFSDSCLDCNLIIST